MAAMPKLAAFLTLAAFCLSALAQTAGRVDLLAGEVLVVDAKAKSRALSVGAEVQQGDTITTGKDGELHVTLQDGSVLALRPDAKMRIAKFQYKERDGDTSVVALLRGAMRTITGFIGRRNPRSVLVQTPTATIGIRGTDHEALVILPESNLGEPGTYDKVNAGGTSIQSARGSIDVAPGQAGFASLAAAPVVLANIPSFFKPTANERRLEGINDANQRSRPTGGGAQKGKDGTQIQGNTRINASGSNLNATASGSGNQAGNRVGTIGGD